MLLVSTCIMQNFNYCNYRYRYLPKSELKNCQNLSDLNRSAISQEVVSFISIASTQIQQLNAMREEVMERSGDRDCRNHYEHYRLVIKDLLNVRYINYIFDVYTCII